MRGRSFICWVTLEQQDRAQSGCGRQKHASACLKTACRRVPGDCARMPDGARPAVKACHDGPEKFVWQKEDEEGNPLPKRSRKEAMKLRDNERGVARLPRGREGALPLVKRPYCAVCSTSRIKFQMFKMPRGSTTTLCINCKAVIAVATKTCKSCQTMQPRKQRLAKKLAKFEAKKEGWLKN
ncbi:hypothetical protein ILYODFUR_004524 [Ilyodon furcidens]|uniref:Uncharacterized protein n=1 Tax=Ilyodon furcidens TaxID=33524 RepID=A0ABV0VBP7_9TELE